MPFERSLSFRLSHPQTAWAAHTYPKLMRKPSYFPPPGDEFSGLDSKGKNGLCVLEMLAVPFKALTLCANCVKIPIFFFKDYPLLRLDLLYGFVLPSIRLDLSRVIFKYLKGLIQAKNRFVGRSVSDRLIGDVTSEIAEGH